MADHIPSPSEYQPGTLVMGRSDRPGSGKGLVLGIVTWLSREGALIEICISMGNVYWWLVRLRQKGRSVDEWESPRRGVSVYSPHQDLLPPRVTVFEVAKRCSRYFQRHLTSYDIRPAERSSYRGPIPGLPAWSMFVSVNEPINKGWKPPLSGLISFLSYRKRFLWIPQMIRRSSGFASPFSFPLLLFFNSSSLFQFFTSEIHVTSFSSFNYLFLFNYLIGIIRILDLIAHILIIKSNIIGIKSIWNESSIYYC